MNFVEQLMQELSEKEIDETADIETGKPYIIEISIKGHVSCKSAAKSDKKMTVADFKKGVARDIANLAASGCIAGYFFPKSSMAELLSNTAEMKGVDTAKAIENARKGIFEKGSGASKEAAGVFFGLPFQDVIEKLCEKFGITERGATGCTKFLSWLEKDSSIKDFILAEITKDITVSVECA